MILIVDDDPSVIASLELLCKREGYVSRGAATPEEALERLAGESFRLVLQDMNFSRATSGEEGLALLAEIRRRWSDLPVVLLTAWGSIDLAVAGMKAGASDFITKPWQPRRLLQAVATALDVQAARAGQGGVVPSREEIDERGEFAAIAGRDPKLLRLLDLVARVAPTDASVLITGESGTGKELFAEALHGNSPRRGGPFVKVNLGGVSSTLFESEMFGHVKGAFTDARESRPGRFAVADGGTIFLDEIGETDPPSQVKLLRVLQDRTYEVLGSSETRHVDVRVIAATNRDLGKMVVEGTFREDLLYRLNLISIELPTLRERPGDVPLLAKRFLAEVARRYGREAELTDDALSWLAAERWPGNVRQLRQVIERAVLVHRGETIGRADLVAFSELGSADPRAPATLPDTGTMTLEEMERAMIAKALEETGGNISRAAKALGLSRAALYRRCEKFGLDPQAPSGSS